jgi:hypothetical protein
MQQPITRMSPLALAVLMHFSSVGCAWNNGAPKDLRLLLLSHGVVLEELDHHAPWSSRTGTIVARYDAASIRKIIAALDLREIARGAAWELPGRRLGISPTKIWGAIDRPPGLKLNNGGQFQFLYLVIDGSDKMYLITEYSYG